MQYFNDISVLITGWAGFVGSHLAHRLSALGARVSVLERPGANTARLADISGQIRLLEADTTDFESVKSAVLTARPVVAFHLAAYVNTSRSLELMSEMLRINLGGTVNLVNALREIPGFRCLVNTGTSEEYGSNTPPFREEQREQPVSPYAVSKLAATYFLQMAHTTSNFPGVTLRPFVIYGPGQEGQMLIPSLIQKCLRNEDFDMTPGEQSRDFVYVADVVDSYLKAAVTPEALGQVINLCSGTEHQIRQVVESVIRLCQSKTKPNVGALPYRAGENMHWVGSNRKAKLLLDWSPQVDLEQGLKETIAWYCS